MYEDHAAPSMSCCLSYGAGWPEIRILGGEHRGVAQVPVELPGPMLGSSIFDRIIRVCYCGITQVTLKCSVCFCGPRYRAHALSHPALDGDLGYQSTYAGKESASARGGRYESQNVNYAL
jgi:hypothetical protein